MIARDLYKGFLRLLFAIQPEASSSNSVALNRSKLRPSSLLAGILFPIFRLLFSGAALGQWVVPVIPGPGPNTAIGIGNNCFEMTNGGGQRGVIWNANTLNLANPFNIGFSVRFDTWGADGLAMVLQNAGTNATGAGGNALGFGDAVPADPNYGAITQSIAFELDTWNNSGAGIADIPQDHIAIHQNGNTTVASAGPVNALALGSDVTDNVCRRMRITWSPATNTINIFFRQIHRLSANIDLINTVFGGNPIVNWGFTASSGGTPMRIEICTDRYWANAGPDRSVCLNDTLHMNASAGATYLWDTGLPTLSNPNISNPIFAANAVGPVDLEVAVVSLIGCTDLDTTTITVEPTPTAITGGPFTQCLGGNVQIGGASNPNYSYLWSPGGALTNPAISDPVFSSTTLGGHPLQLIVTDNNTTALCRDTATTSVTVLDTPSVSISATLSSICPGQSSTLTANGLGAAPLSYLWSTSAVSNSISVSAAGTYSVTVTDANLCRSSSSITIGALAAPTTFIGNDTTVCPGQPVNLDAGAGFTNYAWSHGPIVQTTSPSTAGTFSVTVTNASGCIASDTILVSNFAQPVVSVGTDTAVCNGDSLGLNATAGFSNYLWNTGQTTASIMALSPGAFDVTVTDLNGCLASDTMNFSWHPQTVTNLGPDLISCTGSSAVLDAGPWFVAYLWSTGQTTQTITVNAPDIYSVTVTDMNLCQGSDTIDFSWQGSLPIDIGADTVICIGDSITLDAGFPGSTYLWSTGQNGMQIQVAQPGQYIVQVTDVSGCLGTDTLNLGQALPPNVNLGSDTTICNGTALSLDGGNAGATFLWSTGAASQQILANTAGQYTVTVTDLIGCSASDSIMLSLQALPTPNLGPDLQICPNSTTLLSAPSSTGTLLWSDGSTANSLLVNQAGTYWIQETDNLNCQGTDTVLVSWLPVPNVSFSSLQPEYCLQDASEILNGTPIGGTFSTNVGPGVFDPPSVGIGQHWVSYTYADSLGCTSIDSQLTNVLAPPSTAQAGPDLKGTSSLNLSAVAPLIGKGHWETLAGNGTFSDANSPTAVFSPLVSTPIQLIWIIENPPCPTSRDSLWITFEGVQIPTGFSPNGDGINDLFVIRGIQDFPEAKLTIFNRWGEPVWEKENYRNDWEGTNSFDQPLSDDTYFYVLEYGGKTSSNFVILKR